MIFLAWCLSSTAVRGAPDLLEVKADFPLLAIIKSWCVPSYVGSKRPPLNKTRSGKRSLPYWTFYATEPSLPARVHCANDR